MFRATPSTRTLPTPGPPGIYGGRWKRLCADLTGKDGRCRSKLEFILLFHKKEYDDCARQVVFPTKIGYNESEDGKLGNSFKQERNMACRIFLLEKMKRVYPSAYPVKLIAVNLQRNIRFGPYSTRNRNAWEVALRLLSDNPELGKFIEMCFDPQSPMNGRLKEARFRDCRADPAFALSFYLPGFLLCFCDRFIPLLLGPPPAFWNFCRPLRFSARSGPPCMKKAASGIRRRPVRVRGSGPRARGAI